MYFVVLATVRAYIPTSGTLIAISPADEDFAQRSCRNMKRKSFAIAAGAAATTLAMTVAMWAQPLYDRIHANIPYPVVLGDKVLQPGDYTIQQLPSTGGGARILLFYTDNGMKFETSAMTIPALDPNTARDTRLVLNHTGEDYYINKIWVQGKDYGYELPIPERLKSREKEK